MISSHYCFVCLHTAKHDADLGIKVIKKVVARF